MIRKWLTDIEGIVMLLFAGMIFFTGVLIFVEYRFESDPQVFQVVASLVAGFSGAFFGILKNKQAPAPPQVPPETPPPTPPPTPPTP